MYSPSASSGSRSSQGGNPNIGIVLGALLILLVGLVLYIFNRPAQEFSLLKQLPPEPVVSDKDRQQAAGNTGNQINPKGDQLLKDVLSKPQEPNTAKAEDDKKKKAEAEAETEQAKDAIGATPDAPPTQAPGDSLPKPAGSTVSAQFSGSSEYTYTVKPGETLFRLASRFRNPATQIKQANNLPDENVQVGQTVKIKIQGIHKVGAGEGLNAIARTYGVTTADLRRANDLAGDQIRLGQELVIPMK